jgi:hypothetical protein
MTDFRWMAAPTRIVPRQKRRANVDTMIPTRKFLVQMTLHVAAPLVTAAAAAFSVEVVACMVPAGTKRARTMPLLLCVVGKQTEPSVRITCVAHLTDIVEIRTGTVAWAAKAARVMNTMRPYCRQIPRVLATTKRIPVTTKARREKQHLPRFVAGRPAIQSAKMRCAAHPTDTVELDQPIAVWGVKAASVMRITTATATVAKRKVRKIHLVCVSLIQILVQSTAKIQPIAAVFTITADRAMTSTIAALITARADLAGVPPATFRRPQEVKKRK